MLIANYSVCKFSLALSLSKAIPLSTSQARIIPADKPQTDAQSAVAAGVDPIPGPHSCFPSRGPRLRQHKRERMRV